MPMPDLKTFPKHPNQEWNPRCHDVIRENLKWCSEVHGPAEVPHLFTDIESLNPSPTYAVGDSYRRKKHCIFSTPLQQALPCCTCFESLCAVPDCDFGVSGLPCQDMSACGKRLKREGRTSGVYLTHGKFNKIRRTPLLLVECTPDSWQMLDCNLHSCYLLLSNPQGVTPSHSCCRSGLRHGDDGGRSWTGL